MRDHKQNVFDDFHAAAEKLIADGWTTREQLAISGGSNGGLLVGAAITQRPDLYAAAVCSAPLLDMVRYERFGLGQTWNDEYGTAADPEQLGWLLSYSPYHHVRDRTSYPPVLFTVFDSDTRWTRCMRGRCAPRCSAPHRPGGRTARSCCDGSPMSGTERGPSAVRRPWPRTRSPSSASTSASAGRQRLTVNPGHSRPSGPPRPAGD